MRWVEQAVGAQETKKQLIITPCGDGRHRVEVEDVGDDFVVSFPLHEDIEKDALIASIKGEERGCAALFTAITRGGGKALDDLMFPEPFEHYYAGIEAMRTLIALGADPNAKDEDGNSILHAHSSEWEPDQADIVRLLIESGAEVNAPGSYGQTPLHYAASNGHDDIVAILINAGADPFLEDEFGDTADKEAFIHGHHEINRIFRRWFEKHGDNK